MDKKQKQALGKASRKAGKLFESRVRKDMEDKGWIVDRWSNDIDFDNDKLVHARFKYAYNPKLKMRIPISLNSGFPDFICFKFYKGYDGIKTYQVIGVESKIRGGLDKEEKRKCAWLLKNYTLGKILVASKHKEGRRVVVKYKEVER